MSKYKSKKEIAKEKEKEMYKKHQEIIDAISYMYLHGGSVEIHPPNSNPSFSGGFYDELIGIGSHTDKPIHIEKNVGLGPLLDTTCVYIDDEPVCKFSYNRLFIYRPGKWEKYMIDAADNHKIKLQKMAKKYKKEEKIKKKVYEKTKYQPIDDSKYFN